MNGKLINVELPILPRRDIICNEEDCRYRRQCANHSSAGDFRSEDGFKPRLHLRQGKVYCETIGCPCTVGEFEEYPSSDNGIGSVRGDELKEETDNYYI